MTIYIHTREREREGGDRQIDREKERQRDHEQNTLRKLLWMKTIKTVDTSTC